MEVKIARIRREYISEFRAERGIVDVIVFKHHGIYYRLCSYGKRFSQKGRKFSSRRWISRGNISISVLRNNSQLLSEVIFWAGIENINLSELVDVLSHYNYYLKNCGMKIEENLIEDFDVILD
jgi:hypothetical protein